MIRKIVFATIITFTFSCKQSEKTTDNSQKTDFKYAKNISFSEDEHTITIESNGNVTSFNKNELPITNVMVETTAGIAYLNELEALSAIKGIVDPNYIYNPEIVSKIKNKEVLEIGNMNELYLELILQQKPELIIASTNPILAKYHQQLEQNGVKILYINEYLEHEPLGRLEYLKVFGKILKKEEIANQRFESIENKYDSIKTIIQTQGNGNVTTLMNTMFGDVWYLPAKNTLQAKLINDAKGNYIFNKKQSDNALNLSFEEVYAEAKNATHWINPSYNSLAQMKASYPNYSWFEAYKNGNVYNSNKRSNANGAQDYFEQGIIRPDIILNDLGKIFYPELFPNYELYFYQQLK